MNTAFLCPVVSGPRHVLPQNYNKFVDVLAHPPPKGIHPYVELVS